MEPPGPGPPAKLNKQRRRAESQGDDQEPAGH